MEEGRGGLEDWRKKMKCIFGVIIPGKINTNIMLQLLFEQDLQSAQQLAIGRQTVKDGVPAGECTVQPNKKKKMTSHDCSKSDTEDEGDMSNIDIEDLEAERDCMAASTDKTTEITVCQRKLAVGSLNDHVQADKTTENTVCKRKADECTVQPDKKKKMTSHECSKSDTEDEGDMSNIDIEDLEAEGDCMAASTDKTTETTVCQRKLAVGSLNDHVPADECSKSVIEDKEWVMSNSVMEDIEAQRDCMAASTNKTTETTVCKRKADECTVQPNKKKKMASHECSKSDTEDKERVMNSNVVEDLEAQRDFMAASTNKTTETEEKCSNRKSRCKRKVGSVKENIMADTVLDSASEPEDDDDSVKDPLFTMESSDYCSDTDDGQDMSDVIEDLNAQTDRMAAGIHKTTKCFKNGSSRKARCKRKGGSIKGNLLADIVLDSSSEWDEDNDSVKDPLFTMESSKECSDTETLTTEDTTHAQSKHSCNHNILLEESLICRDKENPRIFCRKVMKTSEGDRVYNNYHCCFLCKKLKSNMRKHLPVHKNNDDIKKLVAMKGKGDKATAIKLQTYLINKGDHEHNLKVVEDKSGELLLSRRQMPFSSKLYGPCPLCLEWIKIVTGSCSTKHQNTCVKSRDGKLSKGEVRVNSQALMGNILPTATSQLVSQVFPIMTNDEITQIAKSDSLIVGLGNYWLRENIGNRLKRKNYTSQKMRGAARLLQILRSRDSTQSCMADYLKPGKFDKVAEAALHCGIVESDDVEELRHPSAAIKIKYDIIKMVNLRMGLALRNSNEATEKECRDFLFLLKAEWGNKVAKLGHKLLRERRMNKPIQNANPEDLKKLASFLKCKLQSYSLRVEETTNAVYRDVAHYALARILTYNKRRSGELEQMLLSSYENRSTTMETADTALMGDLTETEKALLGSQEIVKIQGKAGHIVPVLIPPDVTKPLAFLAKKSVRSKADVKDDNLYVFGNTGNGAYRAYDALKRACVEAEVTCPDRITSVNLRKYFATMTQVIGMNDNEIKWICKHLGHSVDVHQLHYRATSGYIERINIGKLMLLQDLNVVGKFKGKKIEDIHVEDILKESEQLSEQTDSSEQYPKSGTLKDLEDKLDGIAVPGDGKGVTKPGQFIFELFSQVNIAFETKNFFIDLLDKIIVYLTTDTTSGFHTKGAGLTKIADILKIVFSREAPQGGSFYQHQMALAKAYKVHIQQTQANNKNSKKLDLWTNSSAANKQGRVLSYWCFSPGHAMSDLVAHGIKCVILTSGTLSPLDSFTAEMQIPFPVRLENPHVIEKHQIWIGAMGKGPDGTVLNSNYQTRFNESYQASLGNSIVNFARVVPNGMLVFFPSYPVMEKCLENWQQNNIWNRISQYKAIFVEPRGKGALYEAMEEFYEKINDPALNGAIFVAVCRGKVSEGLDFSDMNGRAVIVTGLPYPPRMDPKIILKMQFLDEMKGKQGYQSLTGNEWYKQQASRAVNQAIGRVIRHRYDYGAIILCDTRFSSAESVKQLPVWVRPYVTKYSGFGQAIKDVMVFFKAAEKTLPVPEQAKKRRAPSEGCQGAYFMPTSSRSAGPPTTLQQAKMVAEHVKSLRSVQDDSIGIAKLKIQYENSMQTTSKGRGPGLLNALNHSEEFSKDNILDDSLEKKSMFNKPALERGGRKIPTKKKIVIKKRESCVPSGEVVNSVQTAASSNHLHKAEVYIAQVKKSLSDDSYKIFSKALQQYKKFGDYNKVASTIASLFTEDSANFPLLRKFYSFVRPKDKKDFDELCRNITGEGCGYRPEDAVSKKRIQAESESQSCKRLKTELGEECMATNSKTSTHSMKTNSVMSMSHVCDSSTVPPLSDEALPRFHGTGIGALSVSSNSEDNIENINAQQSSCTNKISDFFVQKKAPSDVEDGYSKEPVLNNSSEDLFENKPSTKPAGLMPSLQNVTGPLDIRNVKRQPSGYTCAMCRQEAHIPFKMSTCRHVCCFTCWRKVFETTKTCPECSEKVRRRNLTRLMFNGPDS